MNEGFRHLQFLIAALSLIVAYPSAAQQEDSSIIGNGSNVALEFTLSLSDGSVVGSNVGKEPLAYVQGEKQILPALEQALTGMRAGDEKQVTLSADDAYGQVQVDAFREIPPRSDSGGSSPR